MNRLLLLATLTAPCLLACGDDPEAPPLVEVDDRNFWGQYPINAAHTEGGIYDPAGHAFFVGSLGSGGVYRVDAETGVQSTLFEPAEPGVWWTLGMDLDVVDNRLYVCAMDDRRELDEAHDYAGWLWGFDLASGERVVRLALGDAADGGTCTDVAVAEDGTVYVNDRQNPRLYAYADGALEMIVEDDELAGGLVGQNALVVTPDQSALLSLVYLPSKLVRIDLGDYSVREVEIDGDFSDLTPALSGADGMALDGEDGVLVMFTSQLNRLVPVTPAWREAVSTTVDVEGGQTDIVETPAGHYMLNGQAVDFALGSDPDPSVLRRFVGEL